MFDYWYLIVEQSIESVLELKHPNDCLPTSGSLNKYAYLHNQIDRFLALGTLRDLSRYHGVENRTF